MSANCLSVSENTSALSDVVSTDATPGDLRGVGLLEDINLLTIDFDSTICLLDSALEAT